MGYEANARLHGNHIATTPLPHFPTLLPFLVGVPWGKGSALSFVSPPRNRDPPIPQPQLLNTIVWLRRKKLKSILVKPAMLRSPKSMIHLHKAGSWSSENLDNRRKNTSECHTALAFAVKHEDIKGQSVAS
jgi:hypothetical protein